MARRRPAPPHLDGISGAELRRREEPEDKKRAHAMAAYFPPRVHGPTREDFERLPAPTAYCWRCGAGVIWSPEWSAHEHAHNRDGTLHQDTCEGNPMTATAEKPFIQVQSGPRNARTDPDSGLRFYRWQGRDLPSVTSARRMAGLPFGLHQWTVGKVIDHALDNSAALVARLKAGDAGTVQVLRTELRAAGTAERDAAASLGTAVHDAAAAGRALSDVDPAVAPRLRQYLAWLRSSGAEVLASEFQVWNLTVGYAGTVDLLVRFPNGQTWLVDLKTGKGLYAEHALQVVAYAQAEFVGQDDVVDQDLSRLLRQVSGVAVLHLQDSAWGFHVVRYDAETWAAFRGLLEFATWTHTHSQPAAFVTASREGQDSAA